MRRSKDAVFSHVLGKKNRSAANPRNQWGKTLESIGFSADGIRNFIEMTDAVISGKSQPEDTGTVPAEMGITLEEYLEQVAKSA